MKVAVVTGASRGIGRTVAVGLAADGYSLALVARNGTQLDQVKSEALAKNQEISVLTFAGDVSDSTFVAKVVQGTAAKFGRIDLLFNNAGVFEHGSLDLPEGQFKRQLEINLTGPFNFMQHALPLMLEQKSGYILNLASRCGMIGFPEIGAYCASKFGLFGLGESLYRELSPKGIKITTICPSWTNTDMALRAPMPDEEKIATDDILETIRYLLSLTRPCCVKEIMIECRADIH